MASVQYPEVSPALIFHLLITGLLSDAIGYKSVLIVDIILICLSTTSYIFVPVSHNKDQQSQTFWIVFGLQTFITVSFEFPASIFQQRLS